MSNTVYPTLPGLAFPVRRTPIFKTHVAETVSGREFRAAMMPYPRIKYTLKYEVLSDADFRTLVGFFNARRGRFDSFKFIDPDDTSVTAQVIGVGDGVNKTFQLVRALGGFAEPIYDVGTFTGLYLDGVLQSSGYSLNAAGAITFTTAPAAGKSITWTGTYYWRCRFIDDQADLEKFMDQLWQSGKVEFITTKP